MYGPDPGDLDLAGDVELDLLFLCARASTLNALDRALDIGTGLAAIQSRQRARPNSRPPPARAGPVPASPAAAPNDRPYRNDETDREEPSQ